MIEYKINVRGIGLICVILVSGIFFISLSAYFLFHTDTLMKASLWVIILLHFIIGPIYSLRKLTTKITTFTQYGYFHVKYVFGRTVTIHYSEIEDIKLVPAARYKILLKNKKPEFIERYIEDYEELVAYIDGRIKAILDS